VTLLGDAAHLMARRQAQEPTSQCTTARNSAKSIAANPGDVEAALFAYEEALFPRSAAEAADTPFAPGDRPSAESIRDNGPRLS
jgi:hypothetical protein